MDDNEWRRIDNTGKIFPATSNKKDTRVFRLYSELNEEINPDFLQAALDKTMEQYPLFNSVIRKGMFWYYLEESDIRAKVGEETKAPCSIMYVRDMKTLLFQVTYYKNRINFEVFHALTDGTGAVEFIRELTKNYLYEAHKQDNLSDVSLRKEDATKDDYKTDSFEKYYENKNKHIFKKNDKTYQIKGERCEYGQMGLFERVLSTKEVVAKAKAQGVSVTVYLTAVLMCAINEERHTRNKRPIGIMIPVNLRKYFKSESMLNFFGWISPAHDFEKNGSELEDVIKSVKETFVEELKQENVYARMNKLIKIEKNPILRGIPLELKIISVKVAASMSSDGNSAVYSNIGAIHMPQEYAGYIKRFGFFVSTPKLQLCTCSYEDEFSVSFTSAFTDVNIQRNFMRILKEDGVENSRKYEEYPERKIEKPKGEMFIKLFSFLMISIAVITAVLDASITPTKHWALYSILGAGCMWITTVIGFYKRRNMMKNALWQQLFVVLICILWDIITGFRGWSVDIVFPAVNTVIMISLFLIPFIQKLKMKDYVIYYLMSAVMGMIPGILAVAGVTNIAFPSYIGTGISFLVMVGLAMFKWKEVKSEMKKKFHV